jgi:glycosyltransferase involved in cell wall biosynthesis
MARDLTARGIEVRLRPTAIEEKFAPVPEEIRRMIATGEDDAEWELLLHPPNIAPRADRKTVFFTMWETTRLPAKAVRNLNRAECIVVPCQWNAESFRACGVTRPIQVLPLGIKTEVFRYAPMKMRGPCVFGAGGRLRDSDPKRKRVDLVIELFQEAFPDERDVELWVKVFPDCPLPRISDPRVKFTQRYMSEPELAEWFRGLTCFVSGARAEGWGLMQHQALATGRPIISARYGGVAEFFSADVGYEVSHTVQAAEGRFDGCGEWAEPNPREIVAAMRRVYEDRAEAQRLGRAGAKKLQRSSWRRANAALAKHLRALGVWRNRRAAAHPPKA